MPKVAMLNQDGTTAGDVQLNEAVFGIEPNNHVIHQAVVMQQAAKRQGTHAVKNRSDVRGGGRKPWKQKGTGRARQGSIRSPQWVGGGVVFGPTTKKDYTQRLPKKVRRLALKSALSSKVLSEDLVVLTNIELDAPKTKDFVSILNAINVNEKVLIVTAEKNENIILSSNNLKSVKVTNVNQINVLDLVAYDKVIFTKAAVEKAGEVFA